jgi:hypothetical protein
MRFGEHFTVRELDHREARRDAVERNGIEPVEQKVLTVGHLMRSLAWQAGAQHSQPPTPTDGAEPVMRNTMRPISSGCNEIMEPGRLLVVQPPPLWRTADGRESDQTAAPGRKQDRARVAGGQDYEVRYEAKKTGRSNAGVKKAARKVGPGRKRVERRLAR